MINTLDSRPQMKNEQRPLNPFPRIANLELIKTLNYGISSKVKLGRDIATKQEYAVKIIKPDFQKRYLSSIEQEAKFLSALTKEGHPNIVKLIDYYPKADYIKKDGTIKKVFALVLELAEGGDLFECLKALENFREDIARTYFRQLIETVEFLQDKGIIHRDIKPDNLLLGADFTLRIADFSFATYALMENDTPLQREVFGTVNYMAPELLSNNNNYIGQCVDLFSCGVILFLMVVGQPPFDKASEQDVRYRYIMKNQYAMFWKQYERGSRTFSTDFKNLINAMLAYDPAERLTLCEVKEEQWYLGKTCSPTELKEEYEKRKLDFLRYQEEKAKETQKIKEDRALMKKKVEDNLSKPKLNCFMMKGITPLKHRSISEAIDQEIKGRLSSDDLNAERITNEYIFTGYRGLTEAFYNVSQETLFKLLILLSAKLFNNTKIHPVEFKIKGRVVSDNNEFTGDISIKITKMDDFSCCLGFTRIKGPLVPFYKYIEETIKGEIDTALKKLVDAAPE